MRTRRLLDRRIAALGALAVATVLLVGANSGGGATKAAAPQPVIWRGLVGGERAQVPIGQRMIVVLKTPSVADHLAEHRYATEGDERRWTTQAYAAQQQVLTILAAHGLGVRPDHSYARVLDGFAAPLDPRAVALLQRDPEVQGIYPVRIAFPASLSTKLLERKEFAAGQGRRPDVELPGFDGRGVTIALLDTGVDRAQPYLRGRVLPGIDLVDKGENADARSSPQDPSRRERHGTELAGLLVGGGGPGGLRGVATGASVLPIRVAGWQPDAEGRYAVYARSDQLIAGLDRAVDPNGDGDAHDAARVALVGVAEPYAAFADGPEAMAVEGALALDTMVVAPAGNDARAGPLFGSVSGPGGAPAALTVGATDGRVATPSVRVVLRRGLQVLLNRTLPLLGSVAPARAVNLAIATPRATTGASGSRVVDFFNRRGLSLVAGRAALVPTHGDPVAAATAAVRAGASAVILYGESLPAGALGLSDEIGVPVVTVPAGPVLAVLAARDLGVDVGASIGSGRSVPNTARGTIAGFSARGLAFDGSVKPDLAAAGIGLATSDPGTSGDGEPMFATVNGTSAAAASVAGAAALLAQARPDVDGAALKSLLAGFARPTAGISMLAQGAGVLDLGASATGEVATEPTTLGFGTWEGPAWSSTRTLVVRNVSSRRLRLGINALPTGGESELLTFTVKPSHLTLRAGRAAEVMLKVRLAAAPREAVATGVIEVVPDGGQRLRVPWAIGFRHYAGTLLARVRLRDEKFKPSDVTPSVLEIQAGRLVDDRGVQVQPVSRLDILLYDATGRYIGLLARVRDLLPGSYSFGITGRDPVGTKLEPGRYELRVVGWPTLSGRPSRALVRFEIE
jgi:subtilisin family serine protease